MNRKMFIFNRYCLQNDNSNSFSFLGEIRDKNFVVKSLSVKVVSALIIFKGSSVFIFENFNNLYNVYS